MNYLKRIEIKQRPQHFQQGGNIAIGSPKPYTTTLPGVNFNPLTLNNAPIEINTTGISDQIQKMQQLAYDREVLAFKYKDLEYKEGKDYLDFYSNILKGIGGTADSINSMGGAAAFGQYKDQLSSYNAKKNEILQEASRAYSNRDKDAAKNAALKISQLESDPEILAMKYKTKSLDAILKAMTEGKGGYATPAVVDKIFSHLSGGKDAASFEDIVKDATSAMGSAIKATDVQGIFEDYFKLLDPYDQETSEYAPSGGVITKKQSIQRTPETVVNAILSGARLNPVLRSAFLNLGFNPAPANGGYDPNAVEYFTEIVAEQAKARGKSGVSVKITGGQANEKYNPETGLIEKIPNEDGSDGKGPSEGDKDYNRIIDAVRSTYGDSAASDAKIKAIAGGTGDFTALWTQIEAEAKKKGYNTSSAGGKSGVIEGTDLPNTLQGITDTLKIKVDPTTTKEYTNSNGERFIISNDEEVVDKLSNRKELRPGRKTFMTDKGVLDHIGFPDDKTKREEFWDVPALYDMYDGTKVFYLGKVGAEKDATSSAFDPSKLGEPVATTVAELNLPRQKDFKGKINSELGERARSVIDTHTLRITDTSDYPHDSIAQREWGTSFDVNFDQSKVKPSETISNIDKVLEDFRANGLKAIYEVKTQAEKDAILKANKNLKDSDVFVWAKVTGPHFSVTCENCKRLDAIQGKAPVNTGTQQTKSGAVKSISILDI